VRLKDGALPVRKALDHALGIVHGLAAAHDKGIVHRDLKPENVFVAGDSWVKILDFGLAKLTHRGPLADGDERTATRPTESGTVLGTVGYMSPEQVRGEEVDPRSDIFSFGSVLFEMLSGQRAFRRDTTVETMNAILKEDPPELSGTRRGIPPGLARIVQRCLEKRVGDRFHSAHDLALALEAVSSGASRPAWRPLVGSRRLVGAAALVVLAGVSGVAGLWLSRLDEPEAPPTSLKIRPLTSDPGPEWQPALSPNGHLLAFVRVGESGKSELCVKQVDGGGEPLVVSSGEGVAFVPTWSPDGQRIAFMQPIEAEEGSPRDGVFVVSALGGPTRRLATLRSAPRLPPLAMNENTPGLGLSWSPDGTLLAVPHRDRPEDPNGLFLLSIESRERRRLTRPPAADLGDWAPRFSPDGRTLAFIRSVGLPENDIYVVPVDGEGERRLTMLDTWMAGLDWAPDGQSIVFSSPGLGVGSASSLWRVPVSGGTPERLAFGENGSRPTCSREGGRLAYVRDEPRTDIWRVAGPSASKEERSPTRLISSTQPEFQPRYSPDGRHIAFGSMRSGAPEIWICDSDGSNPRQVTFLGHPYAGLPSWSPDGEQIAFNSSKEGSIDVYVVSVSGGVPRRLTTGPTPEFSYSWSRDGRWVYFVSARGPRGEVWKVPAEGGDAVQVTSQGGAAASESRDGRFLYFSKWQPSGVTGGIWRIPRDGGEEIQVLDRGGGPAWALLEEGILFMECGASPPILELFRFGSGEVSQVAVVAEPLPECPWGGLSVSPDGRWVVYTALGDPEADIMLVEGFR
ncbi:MAG: protein kinase, partial [Acidobacteriota bacterium]